jgi:putative peptidoglycan lipid II flippase
MGHVGLALATSLSAFVNAWLLFRGLRRDAVLRPSKGWLRFFLQIGLANFIMGLVLVFALQWEQLQGWMHWGWQERVQWLTVLCGMGLLSYVLILLLTGVRLSNLRPNR